MAATMIGAPFPLALALKRTTVPPHTIRAAALLPAKAGKVSTISTGVFGCSRRLARKTTPDLLTQMVVPSCHSRSPFFRNLIGICMANRRALLTTWVSFIWNLDMADRFLSAFSMPFVRSSALDSQRQRL